MDFGENQKLIFNIISEKQPISESDIKDALPDEKKSISVSTVLKSLKNNKHAIKIKDGLYVVNPDFNVSVQEEATSSSAHEAIVYWPAPNNITTGPYDYKEMILGEKKKGEQLFRVNKRFLSLKNQWECAEENGTDLNCNYVVLINKKNSKKVEKAIQEDQGYIQFSKKVFEYEKIIHGNAFPRNNKDSVTAVVRMIDIENSTQVWRYDRNALIRMVDFILKDDNKFWKRLENGDIKLVDELALASKRQRDNEKSTNGKKSLASKICKYLAEFEFRGKKKYAYYINDSFVRRVVRAYVHYYMSEDNFYKEVMNMNKPDSWSYVELFGVLDRLHKHIEEDLDEKDKINRSCFDHIMWYCYKESGNKEEIAANSAADTSSE